MKKLATITLLVVMLVAFLAGTVNAATESELLEYLDKYSLILLKNGIYTLYARGLLWCKEEPTD